MAFTQFVEVNIVKVKRALTHFQKRNVGFPKMQNLHYIEQELFLILKAAQAVS